MQKIMILLIIFILAGFSFAGIEVLENSGGRIVAKVNFGEFVYEKDAAPMIYLNFTADKNSTPQVSVVPQNRFTVKVPDKLEKYTFAHSVNFSMAQNIPVFFVGVSPVLAKNGNEITYTKEVVVEINYSAGTARNIVPKNDYYDMISEGILNSDRIKNTIQTSQTSGNKILQQAFMQISDNMANKTALRFWIGDEPSASNEKECDLTARVADSAGAGIYKITPSDLSDLGNNLQINSIRIRAANPNVVNDTTPDISAIPEGLVDVPVIIRDKDNNGIFDKNDEILFYAEKIHTWRFNENKTDASKNSWDFLFNYTDFKRYYWVTATAGEVSDKMQKFTQGAAGGEELQLGDAYYRGKRSSDITKQYQGDSYGDKRWVWTVLNSGNSTPTADFPSNFNSVGENAYIRFFEHSLSNYYPFVFTTNNEKISGTDLRVWNKFNNKNISGFSFNNSGSNYMNYDGYALRYSQPLSMRNINNLQFYSKNGAKMPVSYKISGLNPDEYHLFVRHNPLTQKTEFIDSSSTNSIVLSDTSGNGYKYHLATQSGFLSIQKKTIEIIRPATPLSFQITDLLNSSNQSDYLIIAPKEFLSYANELAKHKQDIGQFRFPKVVCVDDIFKIFSGGVFSPEAIRNFMVYTKSWQETSSYLTLFGAGHYNYKNNPKFPQNIPNYIPVYIATATSAYQPQLIAYPVENFFGFTNAGYVAFTETTIPSVMIGRIPAASTEEAFAYLQKIKTLEGINNNAPNDAFSAWRNRPLLIGDDDITNNIKTPESLTHTKQSDDVGRIIDGLDKSADIRKVTLFEYPFDNQLRKPLARKAIIDEINNGVSVMNYIGHGNPFTLSDQRVFDIRESNDISLLTNVGRYFIFLGFACEVGFFDHPTTHGLSSKLVREAKKGAINSISSARTAYSDANGDFANAFFKSLYDKNAAKTIGQAYETANIVKNIPTFALLGDPSFTPMKNRKKITDIKVLNEKKEAVDTLKKMQNVIITGNLPIANDGAVRIAEVILQNPENVTSARKDGLTFPIRPVTTNGEPYQYTLPGMVTARQSFEFSGNSFEIPFMIPPTVIDDTLGTRLKIHIHNKNGGNEIWTGVKDTGLIFSGFDTTNIDINDKDGPSIVVQQFFNDSTGRIDTTRNNIVGNKITIDGFNRRSGTATIDIRISDKSGVDIFSSEAPGGGVSVSIERVMNRRQYNKEDLTLINDDFRNVSLTLPLSQNDFPAVGEYELTISTRDILQNITTKRFILDIKSLKDEQYTIGDFFCYPSPASMGQTTQFFFNQPVDNVSEISLKIYTLNGKLVRSFPNVRRGQTWDLTDQRGRKLSPNVYLYRLFVKRYVRSENDYQNFGNKTEIIKSKVKKLVIYPPK